MYFINTFPSFMYTDVCTELWHSVHFLPWVFIKSWLLIPKPANKTHVGYVTC